MHSSKYSGLETMWWMKISRANQWSFRDGRLQRAGIAGDYETRVRSAKIPTLLKGNAIINGHVDHERSCSAANGPGAPAAPGEPHRQDWSHRTRVRWVAVVAPAVGGRVQGDGI